MFDAVQKLRQSKLFWLFIISSAILIYNYVSFHFSFSKLESLLKNLKSQFSYPGISEISFNFLKTKKNHLDYQLILVRNTCDKEGSSVNSDPNSSSKAMEHSDHNYNTNMVSQLRSTERSSAESSKSVPDLVIYNRVPKCGSTTMLQVLNHVQNANNFSVINQIEPNLSVSAQSSLKCRLKKSRLMNFLA